MFRVKTIHYFILIPLLAVYSLFFFSENLSKYDYDNFDFEEEYENSLAENFINTFPESIIEKTEEIIARASLVDQKVNFTPQAPLAEWSDPRQQDGCEEASVVMAMSWLGLERFDSLKEAKSSIIKLSTWQEENYDTYVDTSAVDTNERLIKEYYKYNKTEVVKDVDLDEIKRALWQGQIVLVPCDGRKLANPNFTYPGPERHMILIRGFDEKAGEFITNDPGTRNGEAYRYKEDILFGAIRDYPSGLRTPIVKNEKNIIIVKPL